MITDWKKFTEQAQEELFLVKNDVDLEKWRIKYLGRKSALSLFFNSLSNLSREEKKQQGTIANRTRKLLQSLFKEKKEDFSSPSSLSFFDIARPGEKINPGHLHPITLVSRQIIKSFENMGFAIIEGPEIETEYYNFDALNIPADHPARDMWDTLWLRDGLKEKLLLRTHTSPEQVRYMETHMPPLRVIAPGRCFRHEATDSSHEVQFHQIEGLMVGEKVNLVNFKAIIELVVKNIFQNNVLVRFRPSYFPFVSPGVEIDIKMKSRVKNQKSNSLTRDWMEIMGAGMVHPSLFKEVGYETGHWQGFAFGLGVERIAMIKYNIDDIRLFFNSDIRFLEQF